MARIIAVTTCVIATMLTYAARSPTVICYYDIFNWAKKVRDIKICIKLNATEMYNSKNKTYQITFIVTFKLSDVVFFRILETIYIQPHFHHIQKTVEVLTIGPMIMSIIKVNLPFIVKPSQEASAVPVGTWGITISI